MNDIFDRKIHKVIRNYNLIGLILSDLTCISKNNYKYIEINVY
jgi:hypothetical protein